MNEALLCDTTWAPIAAAPVRQEDTKPKPAARLTDLLDLTKLPLDRRAEEIRRAVRSLSPGEELWVSGRGDSVRYEHFLQKQFPGEVEWNCEFIIDEVWTARLVRI